MTSQSSEGTSQITLQFALARSIDSAAQDVQAAINAAAGTLPANLPYPPVYAKVNPADAPILTLALTSDALPIDTVSDAADTLLQPKLSEIDGVGRVTVQGGLRPAVRVRVDPARLAAYGLAMEDVRTAVANANVNGAKGGFDGPRLAFALGANDQLVDASAYQALVIAWRNGAPVRMSDVGSVINGVENDRVAAWYKDQPAAVLDIQRQPGANIVQTVALVKAALPRLQRAIPSAIRLTVVTDRTETIRASVRDVQITLIMSVILVVGVIFLFLRSPRATFIPAIALPLSLIGTFGVMQQLGYALDNLSLMALTVATGFVVDDAIVMIENIVRYIEQGMRPLAGSLSRRGADRLHHRVADRVADRGVHPAAVHERRGRPAVQGVRRHAVGRRGGLRGGVADADADDVRPHPAPCAATNTRAASRASARPASTRCCPAIAAALPGPSTTRRWCCWSARRRWSARSRSTSWCRRASCRSRTPACWSPSPRRRRASPSRAWSRCRRRWPRSSSAIRR